MPGRPAPAERRLVVAPVGPFRLPGGTPEGQQRREGGIVRRVERVDGSLVLLRAALRADGRLVLGATAAEPTGEDAALLGRALTRWRRILACDEDLRPFLAAHRGDALIGPSLRDRPWLRPGRRGSLFESLVCAVCEQLIAFEDAVRIERRIAWRHGAALGLDARDGVVGLERGSGAAGRLRRRGARRVLWALPSAEEVAARLVPAHFEACGLAPARAQALHRAARELASGRLDPHGRGTAAAVPHAGGDPDGERVLGRLDAIPEIGSWTLALVATQVLGRLDRPPSGDLNLVKALGRMRTGDPRARATEAEVDALLAPYAPWGALAAAHVMATRGEALPRERDLPQPTTPAAPPPVAFPERAPGGPLAVRVLVPARRRSGAPAPSPEPVVDVGPPAPRPVAA